MLLKTKSLYLQHISFLYSIVLLRKLILLFLNHQDQGFQGRNAHHMLASQLFLEEGQ